MGSLVNEEPLSQVVALMTTCDLAPVLFHYLMNLKMVLEMGPSLVSLLTDRAAKCFLLKLNKYFIAINDFT
jgi:hypothetical protein